MILFQEPLPYKKNPQQLKPLRKKNIPLAKPIKIYFYIYIFLLFLDSKNFLFSISSAPQIIIGRPLTVLAKV